MMKWTKRKPPHKRVTKAYSFMTADWLGMAGWEYTVWDVLWNDEGGYWMLLRDGDEWGCIKDDFPEAEYYAVIPEPPKPRKKSK